MMKSLTGGTLVNNPMCEQAWVGFTSGAMKVGLLDMWEWCLLRVVRSSRAIGDKGGSDDKGVTKIEQG